METKEIIKHLDKYWDMVIESMHESAPEDKDIPTKSGVVEDSLHHLYESHRKRLKELFEGLDKPTKVTEKELDNPVGKTNAKLKTFNLYEHSLVVPFHEVRKEAIKHMKECLKKQKNPLKAWMYSLDIKEEDLKNKEWKMDDGKGVENE